MNSQFHIETVSSLRVLEEGYESYNDESYWLTAARPLVIATIEPVDASPHTNEPSTDTPLI